MEIFIYLNGVDVNILKIFLNRVSSKLNYICMTMVENNHSILIVNG